MSISPSEKRIIEKQFTDDPVLLSKVLDVKRKIENGEYDEVIVKSIRSAHPKYDDFDIYEMYFFFCVLDRLENDILFYTTIDIERGAYPNKDIDNNNKLLKALPSKFKAEFLPESGGGAESDGYFRLEEGTLQFKSLYSDEIHTVKNYSVPLEVGSTKSQTTLKHISSSGLARLDYDTNKMVLFYNAYPSLFKPLSGKGDQEKYFANRDKHFEKIKNFRKNYSVHYIEKEDCLDVLSVLKDINERIRSSRLVADIFINNNKKFGTTVIDTNGFKLNSIEKIGEGGNLYIEIMNSCNLETAIIFVRPNTKINFEILTMGEHVNSLKLFVSVNIEHELT